MLEESIPAIWASMNSWLTPTVLFVVLNLMIGTIAVASGIGGNPQQQNLEEPQQQGEQQRQHPQLVRTPSILQRLKSINLYREEPKPQQTHQQQQRLKSINLYREEPKPQQTHQQQQPLQQVRAPSVLQRLKSINLYRGEPESEQKHQQQQQQVRAPSVLQRLKSINLYGYRSEDSNPFPVQTTRATTITQPPPPEPETHYTQFHETQTIDDHHLQDQDQDQESEEEEEEENHESESEEFFGGEESMDEIYHRHIARSTSDTKPSSGIMPKKLPKKMKKSASTKSAFGHFEEKEIPTRPSTVRERKKTESDVQPFGDDEEVDAKADDFINKFKQQLKLQRLNSIIRYKEMLNRG